jgi:putative membrane protein
MKTLKYGTMALVLSLAACGQKSHHAADATGNSAENASDAVGNVAGNAMMDIKEAVTPTPSAQEFVDKAAKSDAFEVAAAKLAEANASSADVKSFARAMITAHTESTAKIKAAAKKAEPPITPNPALTDDQNKMLADLKAKTGKDFDEAYVSGQVDAHKDALTLMQGYAKNGDTPALKTAAGEIAPIVQKHLDMARTLNK